jgi:dihydroneopterin aldolase
MELSLVINSLKIFAFHGFYEEERKIGHWFEISVIVKIHNIGISEDGLSNSLNYELINEIIKEEMKITRLTLEFVGNEIMKRLINLDKVEVVKLSILKLNPFKMKGVEQVGISLEINKLKNY